MRLQDNPFLPKDMDGLVRQLTMLYREYGAQLNQLSEGQIQAVTNAATAAPTGAVTAYKQGDKVWHSAPVEAGAPGAMYVVVGFVCIASGAPGTWREMRVLTGN